ncbi:MAG: hypothetical protein KDA92_19875 [Planctomycetales bacterium]|nr:hypothetical protein [Planctomycetales bacterium]
MLKRPTISFLLRLLIGGALVIGLIVVGLPTAACHYGWVEQLLNRQLAKRQLSATIGRASIGWLTPMDLSEVTIRDDAESWQLVASQLQGERTLLQLLRDQVELGELHIVRPELTITIDQPLTIPTPPEDPNAAPGDGSAADRSLAVRIDDGAVWVRSAEIVEPQKIAEHVSLRAIWSASGERKRLTIESGVPLDHVQLTPEMCAHGLKYVAPVFADVAWTRGDVSLALDTCEIDLQQIDASRVNGRVTLHEVSTGLRSPLAKAIAQTIVVVTKRDLPESIRVADDSVIEFLVAEGGIAHDGFEFGLPELEGDLVVRTHGVVGFDKSLDMVADIPLPLEMLGDGPLAKTLGRQTLHLPVRGTLDKPEVKLEGNGQLASEVLSELLNPALQGDIQLDDVVDSLKQFREQVRQRREERGPLFPRLRRRQ